MEGKCEPEVQHAPEDLHLRHYPFQLDYCALQIHIGRTPFDLAQVADDHQHAQLAAPDQMQTPICVAALCVLLEKNIKAAGEGGCGRVFV
jgi:hypothetical protein